MKMDNHQTFEENLARLEKIISQLEEGDVPLADSLALFEEGYSSFAAVPSNWREPKLVLRY